MKRHNSGIIIIFTYPTQETRLFLEMGEFGEQKLQNLPPNDFFFAQNFFCNLIGLCRSAIKFDWLLLLFHFHFEGLKKDTI